MSNLVIPYVFQNQTTADANQVDQNFSAIANVVNGNLDDSNMKPQGLTGASIANEGVTPGNTKGVVYAQDLFAQSFIISGGAATRDGTNLNQVNVTSPIVGWVQQSDGSYRRLSATVTNFKTTIPNATYYLDLNEDGTVNWAQTHSSTLNYTTIATVTSDASGNVATITDTRTLNPKLGNISTANGRTVDWWGTETIHGGYNLTINAVPVPYGLTVTNGNSGSVGPNIAANTTYGYQLTSVGWSGVETLPSTVAIPIPSGLNVTNASSGGVGSYITGNTTYSYQLTSVGWNGAETAPCSTVQVTTGSTAHPINLSWTTVGSQVQYINIYKNGNFLAQVSGAATSYQDTGNTATTSQTPPASTTQATQGVYVTTGSTAYPINLTWNAVSKEAQYINIYKNGKFLAQVSATATSYQDTGNIATTTQTPPASSPTAGARILGATTSGPPTSGTFLAGDFVIDQSGTAWICTASGTPGTWKNAASSGYEIEVLTLYASPTALTSTVTSSTSYQLIWGYINAVSPNLKYYFEAHIFANSGGTAYAALYDLDAHAAVAGSTVSTTSTVNNVYRSPAITLVAGHRYSFTLYTSNASYAANCNLARVVCSL